MSMVARQQGKREREREVVADKKITTLLPRGEEKSYQDGLIAFYRPYHSC